MHFLVQALDADVVAVQYQCQVGQKMHFHYLGKQVLLSSDTADIVFFQVQAQSGQLC